MYTVSHKSGYLLISFMEDFNSAAIKAIVRYEPRLIDQIHMDEVWDCGGFQALIGLGDIQPILDVFKDRLCTASATKKIAFVTPPGVTETIMQLLANGLTAQLPCQSRLFTSLDDAESWLSVADSKVA